jgi:hypothetical protein
MQHYLLESALILTTGLRDAREEAATDAIMANPVLPSEVV